MSPRESKTSFNAIYALDHRILNFRNAISHSSDPERREELQIRFRSLLLDRQFLDEERRFVKYLSSTSKSTVQEPDRGPHQVPRSDRKHEIICPPETAIILLKVFLSKADDALIGDLIEKYESILNSRGIKAAKKFFWWHTAASIWPILIGGAGRLAIWLKAFVGG